VGKTLLARLLTDYHRRQGNREVVAFDINQGENTIRQFLPLQARAASINDIKGKMALFDQLIADDRINKIVDLGCDSFAAFFETISHIGFVEEAQRRAIALAVLFIMTPEANSIDAYSNLSNSLDDALLTVVHNELQGRMQNREAYWPLGSTKGVLQFPALRLRLRRYIETPPMSFADADFLDRARVPLELRSELQGWLSSVFREFHELELRFLLKDLRSSLDFSRSRPE